MLDTQKVCDPPSVVKPLFEANRRPAKIAVVPSASEKSRSSAIAAEITRFVKADGPLTKRIRLDERGKVASDGSCCLMVRGEARRQPVESITELANLISSLGSNEAIALGTLRDDLPDTVNISTKSRLDKLNGKTPAHVIARTAENICFRPDAPAYCLLDYDMKAMPETVAAKLKELGGFRAALMTIMPALAKTAHLVRLSTSAGLYRTDTGEKFAGSGGLHLHVSIKDGSDCERFLKTLHERCWLAGLGWHMVGAAGQLMERSIVDRSVGTPERLVFEGAPILEPPLAQDAESRRPTVYEGGALNTEIACLPLDVHETKTYRKLLVTEGRKLAPERDRARTAFINTQTERLVERTGMDAISARQVIKQQCAHILLPEITLPFDDPKLADKTVGDILNDPEAFVGATLADPIEGVEYGAGKAKVLLHKDGTPFINSFAHGGARYKLCRHEPRPIVQVINGKPAEVIDAAEAALIERDPEIFERNESVVYLGTTDEFGSQPSKVAHPFGAEHLAAHWNRHVDFKKFDAQAKDWKSIDCPEKIASTYLQLKGKRSLKKLRTVISTPTLRPDGSILDKPGYDPETRLFYDPCGIEFPPIPLNPSAEQVKKALERLIKPIRLFPFVNGASRSVTLSGILTGLIRPSLPAAPLHSSTAPVAGSGKTKLVEYTSIIVIGKICTPEAETTQHEEFEKKIATALLSGQRLIFFDNCTIPIGNGLLSQSLTGQRVNIRLFNTQMNVDAESTSTIFANGNNLVLTGDVPRRAIRAMLDPQCERPELRQFDFSPTAVAMRYRTQLVVDALTILRAHHVTGRPGGLNRLGSFEDWSDWVRSAITWVGEDDPCATMEAVREADPNLRKLGALLSTWHEAIPKACTVKRAIEQAVAPPSGYDTEQSQKRSALLEAMDDIAGERNTINSRRLGKWISDMAGRVVNGLRFEADGTMQHAVLWKIGKVS